MIGLCIYNEKMADVGEVDAVVAAVTFFAIYEEEQKERRRRYTRHRQRRFWVHNVIFAGVII